MCLAEPRAAALSGVSRFRRWLLPALTVTLLVILIIALGASSEYTREVYLRTLHNNSTCTGSDADPYGGWSGFTCRGFCLHYDITRLQLIQSAAGT